jgi:hypothetical protein
VKVYLIPSTLKGYRNGLATVLPFRGCRCLLKSAGVDYMNLMRMPALLLKMACGKAQIYILIHEQHFPAPLHLGGALMR